jgi:hypothetical protein
MSALGQDMDIEGFQALRRSPPDTLEEPEMSHQLATVLPREQRDVKLARTGGHPWCFFSTGPVSRGHTSENDGLSISLTS